ncbi:MAG: hypothetical protein WCR55_10200 [Lentisphaerota bacterium]
MTSTKQKFFEQVKGKRIRWSSWDKRNEFTPTRADIDRDFMYGFKYRDNVKLDGERLFRILEGFKPTTGGCWVIDEVLIQS